VEGKLAITFDIEGMNALNGQLDLVQHYYEIGVRQMIIAYNRNNLAGSGCHDEDTGLTVFGRQVMEEMNQVDMVIDCSHTGYRTTMEVMER
jgi:membrane dipeptidase